ncbi:MAG: LuxR C-terminal-related transcriptional regulator [Thermomicrobiales bacterium]
MTDVVMASGIKRFAASGLVETKLSSPRLHRDHVSRQRLSDRLEAGSDRPLLLLRAPAGSGKSTLLAEWLAQFPRASGWVSLDEGDNDLAGFLGYVLEAIRRRQPQARLATRDLLQALTLPPLAVLVASLAEDLAQLPSDMVVALDDFHCITTPQIHEFLQQLFRHPPQQLHLAIATRTELPWSVSRLRARGQLTELRYEDLLFTPEESEAFLHKALGDAVDHDLAVVLHAESEGWAAGLQLMALALRGRPAEPAGGARTMTPGGDIEAILLDEVFVNLTPTVQDRLARLSILNRFCAPLCEVVCAADDDGDAAAAGGWGSAFLTGLNNANLFLIPIDGHNEYYRFHHLFQQFLGERLRGRTTPAEIAELHRRASAWFEAHGHFEEALHHALTAGHPEDAADIVARHRHTLYNHEQFARLTHWLRLMPPEVKEHHPGLLLAEARIATMNWRFVEAAVFLDHAELELERAELSPDDSVVAQAELLVLRGILQFWSGDAERVAATSRQALEVLPPEQSHLRGLAHTGMTTSAYLMGNLDEALAYLDTQLGRLSPQDPSFAWLLQTQSFLYWLHGDLDRLRQSATRLLHVGVDIELADQEALAHFLLGAVHYARNDLEAAERSLTKAVGARFIMRLMWWAQAAGLLALTQQALGRQAEAQAILDDAQAFLLERHAMRLLPNIGAFGAELDRRAGRFAAATAWAQQVTPGPLTWALAVIEPRLAQASALLAEGGAASLDQAATLLAELRAFCARLPNRRLCLEVDALSALLDAQQDRPEQALATLREVIAETGPDGWVRLFVDLGEDMEQLLRQLGRHGAPPRALERILAAFPVRHAPAGAPDQSGLIEPLSPRELEILALLGERDSNKEIAARLFISPGTVKRHTISIYRKLDVNDRREAVARATGLGLMPALRASA